jgi:hypothetical protein
MKVYSRIASRLVELLIYLERTDAGGTEPRQPRQAVMSVVQRITKEMGRDAAWDAAEELRLELLYFAPDIHLMSLLEREWAARSYPPTQAGDGWTALYSKDELKALRGGAHLGGGGGGDSPPWREVVTDRLATLY